MYSTTSTPRLRTSFLAKQSVGLYKLICCSMKLSFCLFWTFPLVCVAGRGCNVDIPFFSMPTTLAYHWRICRPGSLWSICSSAASRPECWGARPWKSIMLDVVWLSWSMHRIAWHAASPVQKNLQDTRLILLPSLLHPWAHPESLSGSSWVLITRLQ